MPTKKPAPKQKKLSPSEHLDVAKAHLQKVQAAWDDPTDWSDLMTYGFYCMEACVLAAAGAAGLVARKTHWDKQDLAETLSQDCGLPEATELLRTLNDGRKATAYGDIDFEYDDYDPEDLESEIETYYEAVSAFLTTRGFM